MIKPWDAHVGQKSIKPWDARVGQKHLKPGDAHVARLYIVKSMFEGLLNVLIFGMCLKLGDARVARLYKKINS